MINIKELDTSEVELKEEVIELSEEATRFLLSHKWCKSIEAGYFERGWGYILCVFYFKIKPATKNVDDAVWIIVGDIPPAYIDIKSATDGNQAIKCYIGIMDDWVKHVKNGLSVKDCYPVNVPSEIKYATMLETRLRLIQEDYLE